jgi:hypothetical protein
MSMSLPGYDAWLERPYQDAQAGEGPECPECGAPTEEDKHEQSVDCTECDWSDGVDWDSVAEARAEARELDW